MKKTNDKIPEDWEVVKLGDDSLFELIMGQSPPSAFYNKEGKGLPFLQGNAEFGEIIPIPTIFCSKPSKTSKPGDILISVRAPVGDINLAKEKYCIGRGVGAIRIKNDVDNLFLFYSLKFSKRNLESISGGSTFKAITKKQVENIKISFPPLPEQQAIARVLSTIDDAIQKTDEIVEKTERLKKGVMRDLFKDMELVPLVNYCEEKNDIVAGPFGSNLKVSDYIGVGVPIIRLQNIERNKFIEKDIKYISKEKANELKYHSYKPGDLVLAKLGDPIGKTCIIPNSMPEGIVVADVVRIRVSKSKAIPIFVEYALNSNSCINQLKKETIGSTRPRVNIIQIRNLKVPHFELPQQQKIASILSTIDKKIELERKRKRRLERIKKGLMNDLLTGRKRVKIW
jgi:type I restriction enzyme S subunit